MNKKYIPFVAAIVCAFIFGTIGLFFGAWYGGNYGFIELFGLRGYESAGALFGLIGFIDGLLVGFLVSKKLINAPK
jgi:hypothetical protein